MQAIGIVIIGRNEGNRLHECLLSVIGEGRTIVYVDSGSTDGSVALARSLGVDVVELDLSTPFTAARARNAGFEHLLRIQPNTEFVQFVDGDCQLVDGWLEHAQAELLSQPDTVVVFGRLREKFPERSIYNRLCNIEWNTVVGEAKACGGIAMMRVTALKKIGGFNPKLIAGEEPEMCVRLRQAGGRIFRIDADMGWHDADMTRFGQWWKRSTRSGFAYAQGSWMHGSSPERHWVKESYRIWFWGLLLPLLALVGVFPTSGLSILLLLIANILVGYRVYQHTHLRGLEQKDAILYAVFCAIGKYPQLVGQIRFHIYRLLKLEATIVEYKTATPSSSQVPQY